MWSRNKAGLYIQDALANFQHDNTISISPPWQRKRYCDRLIATHLTGFGGGAAAAAIGNDVTSYDFDGTGDYLDCGTSADWDFNGNDFTIEFWFKQEVSIKNTSFYGMGANGNFRALATGNDLIRVEVDGVEQGWSWVDDTNWHHMAVSRASGTVKVFLDGTEKDSFSAATTSDSGAQFVIGASNTGGSIPYDGRIDEFRIIKGTALYTTGFAAPTAPFTSDANTVLLMHCGETIVSGSTGSGATFVDSGNTGHTITEIGNAIRDTVTYKF